MADLFSYIEHAYVVPERAQAIDVDNESDFQLSLREAADGEDAYSAVRQRATDYLSDRPADRIHHRGRLRDFRSAVESLTPESAGSLRQLVDSIFGSQVEQLVASEQFKDDRQLLENIVVAVKVVTGFNGVDAGELVRALQTMTLLENLAEAGAAVFTKDLIERLLSRPVRIPAVFLIPPGREAAPESTQEDTGQTRLEALRRRRDALQATYESLMTLQPQQLEVATPAADAAETTLTLTRSERLEVADALPGSVRLTDAVRQAFVADQRSVLDELSLDVTAAPLEQVVGAVKQQWIKADQELLPAIAPRPTKVYRLGANVFAVSDSPADVPAPAADFSFAVTRPVGVGNLQVVRQELIGYRAGEISHIENVLEGELLKRSTRREEVSEVVLTDETVSSQSQERDQQSTTRNELAAETQRESGRQSATTSELTSSSSYGKLVENSKSNYAQSTTSRAVDTVVSMVKQQRVQRERKTYVEHAEHQLDNSQGSRKIRGIYQWVDKKYSVRVLNYGRRLLYDVVVPEPAAFLIQSLRDAAQPETFQLTKPADPRLRPSDLNAANYGYYASVYGVTGSVSPPPSEFTVAFARAEAHDVQKELKAWGGEFHGMHYGAFVIKVPDDYRAISGYIQRVNEYFAQPAPGRFLEVYVGEHNYFRFGPNDINFLNKSFTMAGETGDIPVTLKCLDRVLQFNYAVAIKCQRTDRAYEQWQLKTHAAIMSGYQRQLADYQDKLARYVAAVRNQMAAAGGFAHDPTIERDELKKAFIYLLLGEHFGSYLPTPAPAPVPPLGQPPDPVAVKKWGSMVAFFERAFEWENLMYHFYPYFWGRVQRWSEMILTQDTNPMFEAFLKAGAARVVVPVRPGFEAALAHYHETGDLWLGEEIPDMFSEHYISVIAEIKAANRAPGDEVCVDKWEVTLPTTLVMLKEDEQLPEWTPTP